LCLMFSGIIEACSPIVKVDARGDLLTLFVQRPSQFDDIHLGDSIATNGVCLTVESFSDQQIQFTLGQETLKVTDWTRDKLLQKPVNLERSLKFGDRVHGHFVSGHVDATTKLVELSKGESWNLRFSKNTLNSKMIWPKGSVAIQGVSLTINEVTATDFSVCLIPETLLRTNLKNINVGDVVNIEYDTWAKAFVHFQEQREANL
jgi:riboflavin synthase